MLSDINYISEIYILSMVPGSFSYTDAVMSPQNVPCVTIQMFLNFHLNIHILLYMGLLSNKYGIQIISMQKYIHLLYLLSLHRLNPINGPITYPSIKCPITYPFFIIFYCIEKQRYIDIRNIFYGHISLLFCFSSLSRAKYFIHLSQEMN